MITFSLRLPAKLHKFLVHLAKQDKRSLNSEILVALERFANEAGFETKNDLRKGEEERTEDEVS